MPREINLDVLQRQAEAINRVATYTGRPPNEVIRFMERDRTTAVLIRIYLDDDLQSSVPPFKESWHPSWEEIKPELDKLLVEFMPPYGNDN